MRVADLRGEAAPDVVGFAMASPFVLVDAALPNYAAAASIGAFAADASRDDVFARLNDGLDYALLSEESLIDDAYAHRVVWKCTEIPKTLPHPNMAGVFLVSYGVHGGALPDDVLDTWRSLKTRINIIEVIANDPPTDDYYHNRLAADLPLHVARVSGKCTPHEMAKSLLDCVTRKNRSDLIPTVVVDEYETALGLVYSSDASVIESLAQRRGVYWSRSRNSLWRKGDTSGQTQTLLSITLDCDGDALRFKVVQNGNPGCFCHKNVRTCWGETSSALQELFRTLQSRKQSAPPGSYTARLFTEEGLLRKKLLEEADELSEALYIKKDPTEVAKECADVLYFALAAVAAGGSTLREVLDVLSERTLKLKRRQGNEKAGLTERLESEIKRSRKN